MHEQLINDLRALINQTDKSLMTENGNKQATLASTQRDLMAGIVSKFMAKTEMIPEDIVEAVEEGIIKVHDLDYFANEITNCELVNLKDMFTNGTVINRKRIRTPKSLRTASTLATQISAQVASSTYGGQTLSLSHIAPFVRVSMFKELKKLRGQNERFNLNQTEEQMKAICKENLQEEIKDSVQTFNYQLVTISGTNGQSPFVSLAMYLDEEPEYKEEMAMLMEEFLKQRIAGMENEHGVVSTQTFPKLLFFLDEDNMYKSSPYYYLKQLAIQSTAKRLSPDFISVKKMKEVYGYAFPCMGCRSFLNIWLNLKGKAQFYGRGNLGVTTVNLVDIALTSKGDSDAFWNILNERLLLAKKACMIRYDKLKNTKASIAPILWQHGALARLNADDNIISELGNGKFSVSIGYSGLYETVKYMTGESLTSEKGFELAEKIMKYLKSTADNYKEETGLGFGIYGTPQEATAGWFTEKLVKKFGLIDDITDKGYITNSYHVSVREEIDAFSKLDIESKLQNYSTGGNISYVETHNMENNLEAIEQIVDHIYETNVYAEINTESDVCGTCGHTGVMNNNAKTLNWFCPQCGEDNQSKLSVVRRICGYLGESMFCDSRKKDILDRVKHI